MEECFLRTAMLIGEDGLERLKKSRVAVFGLGGVGGYVAEALARAGIGELDLIDKDTISESNLNRQILALHSTIGMLKTEAARMRILDINPGCVVRTYPIFYLPETADALDLSSYDFIADAVDTVTAKLLLACKASEAGVPVISCMGTGNKLDPTAFRIIDISKTTICPLARVMRRELAKRGIRHLPVVWSDEEAMQPSGWEEEAAAEGKRQIPGSMSFVPGAAGLTMAGYIIRRLAYGTTE